MHSLRFFSVTPPYVENKVLTRGPLVTYLYDMWVISSHCLPDKSSETHQNVIDEAKEQDQSQQNECQAKGDP